MDYNPPRHRVSCEIDGKPHRGTYWVAGKILTVSTGMGGKSTQVGGMPVEALAKLLLQKLAQEGKALPLPGHHGPENNEESPSGGLKSAD